MSVNEASDREIGLNAMCAELAVALPGQVSFPSSTMYDASVASYFFKTARESPSCIVSPTSIEDVSKVIKVLRRFPKIKFAFRSGGHSPNPEISNTDNGVTIDLRGLQTLTMSSDDVIQVGAGLNWVPVYEYLDNLNRTVVGARESSVGVGGFVSGGGLSYFAPDLGFACDSVINFEIVLASGEIVNANAQSRPDLYRALKGGQSNFGIITRFDLMTNPHKTLWGGGIAFPISTEEEQLNALWNFKNVDNDPFAAMGLSFLYIGSSNSFLVTNNMVYLRPVENVSTLAQFTTIQPQLRNSMRIDSVKNFAEELQKVQPTDQYALYMTTTYFITATIPKKINEIWKEYSLKMSSISKILSVVTYQQFPPQFKQSPNAMCFDPDAESNNKLMILIVSIYWPEADDYDLVKKVAREMMDQIETATQEEGVYHPYKYVNYAGFWQDSMGSYGKDALEKMKEVSRKYDPDGMFQKQALGFKL